MSEYELEWQTAIGDIEGAHIKILKDTAQITVNQKETNPDKIAIEAAEKIVKREGIKSATLKKIVCSFSRA